MILQYNLFCSIVEITEKIALICYVAMKQFQNLRENISTHYVSFAIMFFPQAFMTIFPSNLILCFLFLLILRLNLTSQSLFILGGFLTLNP